MSSSSSPIYWKRVARKLIPLIPGDTLDVDIEGGVLFDGPGPPVDVLGARVNDYYLDVNSGILYKLKP